MGDANTTAKLLGIEFEDDVEGSDALGLSSEELKDLMNTPDDNEYGEPDEEELMRSLSELGIDGTDTALAESQIPAATTRAIDLESPTQEHLSLSAAPQNQPKHHSSLSAAPPTTRAQKHSSLSAAPPNQPKHHSSLSATPSAGSQQSTQHLPAVSRVPPLRYGATYQAEAKNRAKPPSNDIMDDLLDAFDFGRKAVVEAYQEVKQSVKDLNSVEVLVTFLPTDRKLGIRLERRPMDDACEVTYVEIGSAADRIGIKVDDVVLEVHGQGGVYNKLMKMLAAGERPMQLLLLRPIQLLNSPIHFKLEDEMKKSHRILSSLTSPDAEMEKEVMLDLMSNAIGLVFMTTVKIGGLISGMGGTGILVSRLPDGGWSAPVAVGCFGMSVGLQIGASLADVMIVFMKPSALLPFASEDSTDIHLGPESGIAVGPVGRRAGMSQGLIASQSNTGLPGPQLDLSVPTLEDIQYESFEDHVARSQENGDKIATKMASLKPAYTYSHCKGLFVGVSLEGSALTVRHDVNQEFYRQRVDVAAVLEGGLERPQGFAEFYDALTVVTGNKPPAYSAGGLFAPPVQTKPVWTPPRDSWRDTANQEKPKPAAAWVPPRDKWQSNAFQSDVPPNPSVQAPIPAANPFVDHGDVPPAPIIPQTHSGVQPGEEESFFADEDDETQEFTV